MPQRTFEENEARKHQILDAAAALIVRYGYDKITMSDVANQAGLSRAIIYLHFGSKEELFEALLYQETQNYLVAWLAALEAGSAGGTIADVFHTSLFAVQQSPLLSAMMKQDRQVFGKYLSKPGNLFESFQSRSLWPEILKELQDAGAVRADIQPDVMGHLMNALALGILEMDAGKPVGETPPLDALLAATADMLERALTPEDGGDSQAGRAVLRRLGQAVQAQFAQLGFPTQLVENNKS